MKKIINFVLIINTLLVFFVSGCSFNFNKTTTTSKYTLSTIKTKTTTSKKTTKTTTSISEITTVETTKKEVEYPLDYKIEINEDRDIRILQISDPQVWENDDAKLQNNCYCIMDYVVEQTQPDLILVAGDIVYGRYDDNGEIFEKIVNHFESYGIPWAPIFGNHDNESKMGVNWQCTLLENSEHCLFVRRTELTGKGNYSIGIFSNGELIRTIYMLDTKGCNQLNGRYRKEAYGLDDSQVEYVIDCQEKAAEYQGNEVEGFICQHVMMTAMAKAMISKYGVDVSKDENIPYTFTTDGDDFGSFGENTPTDVDANNTIFNKFKNAGITGIFTGHDHINNASVVYQGVRLTYGLKSSLCDSHNNEMLGGTLISVNASGFNVEHVYYPASNLAS